ncbi:RHS repeat-associated core domain-containing protein [Actinoplanes sp. GCM10030250]|uniref:RHS repeat-associated core domain-containing protein n=1 Tax=Actinoplanes sp. GCM10030250 TaxID=3273376 RepID=UPI00361C5763
MSALAAGLLMVPATAAQAAEPAKPLPAQRYDTVPLAEPAAARVKTTVDGTVAAAKVKRPAPEWPAAATAETPLIKTRARAGRLPVLVAAPGGVNGGGAAKAKVSTLDRAAAARSGVDGLLLRVSTESAAPAALDVTVEYDKFATAFGADGAARLQLVALPDCDPGTECRPVPLPTRNDARARTATAQVPAVSAAGTTVALTTGPSSGAGTFTATDLKPSALWTQSGSSGDFTWSYGMSGPATTAGPEPDIGLSYSAQSVDGRHAASNNQPGQVGEGFSLGGGGYIERRYKTCQEDMGGPGALNTTKTGDLCWGTDNAVLQMPGSSGELLKDSDGKWHLTSENASKIERLTSGVTNGDNNNEHWKVTTADGTQYWFGRSASSAWTVPVFGNNTNDECRNTTFANSWCNQAWRWNLDQVVDINGNTMTYTYTKETNKYAKNQTSASPVDYVRGGYLERIDYGGGNQVVFTNSDRCLANCGTKNPTTFPDTPWDLDCSVAPKATNCLQGSPTFWSAKRVSKVTTNQSGSPVDSWTFDQSFPDPGDGTRPGLWLKSVTYTGLNGGSVPYPSVSFEGVQKPNRVDSSGGDWALAMNWWRVNSIRTETGGQIFVTYSDPDCVVGSRMPAVAALDNNALRCYPVKWTPEGRTTDVTDYFHKYVVTDIQEIDHAGGNKTELTHYDYENPGNQALWHYDMNDGITPTAKLSWAQWRGYPRVVTTLGGAGEQSRTETLYYRGMHGDRLANGTARSVSVTDRDGGTAVDHEAFAGKPREQITYDGSTIVEATVTDFWQSAATATRTIGTSTVESRFTGPSTVRVREGLDGGGWRRTKAVSTYDNYGMVTQVADLGEETPTGDDECTATEYARNITGTNWLLTPVKRTHSWAGSCATAATTEAQIIGDTRHSFDTLGYNATPTKGQVTTTETISGFSGGTRGYHVDKTNKYDAVGRVTETTDVTGARTRTVFTPSTGAPTTRTVVTNHLDWPTTTDFNPARGLPTKVTDSNGRITEYAYDAAGRTTDVWSPGRPRATFGSAPTAHFDYTLIKADGITVKDASTVVTKKLDPNGAYRVSHEIFDGFLRDRQTQTVAYGGPSPTEKIVTDTFHDSAGRLWKTNDEHAMAGLPTGKIKDGLTLDDDVPRQTVRVYDGAGRITNEIQLSEGAEKWRTTTSYHGTHTAVTPPQGGIGVTTYTDSRDRTTAVREHHGRTPTGGYDETKMTYHPAGKLATVVDASGNTWSYTYDIRGRQTQGSDPDQGTTITTYNLKDQAETVKDAENRVVATTYDDLGRRTSMRDGTITGAVRASWTYDTPYKGATATSTRNVTANGVTSAYVRTLVSVDAEYRPKLTRVTIPAAEGALAGTYDSDRTYKADGSPATVVLPAAGGLAKETVTYEYDDVYGTAARLKAGYTGAAYYVNQATYTSLYEPSTVNRSTQLTGAGFVSSARYYDESTGRVERRSVTRSVGSAYVTNATFDYDEAGNIRLIDDNAAAGRDTQCFRYDHHRRLTEAWTPASADCTNLPASAAALGGPAPYWQSWSFGTPTDPIGRVGNRRQQVDHATTGDVTTTYAYPAAGSTRPHGVTGTTRTGGTAGTYAYDQAGNTVSRPGLNGQQTLTWDAEGSLATVTDASGAGSYIYDADGERLISRDSTGTTVELGDTQVRLAAGASTATAIRYYTFGGETIAQRDSGGLRWLAADSQGTAYATITADTSQTLTQRRSKPYGEARGVAVTWVNARGYLGGQADPTGLTHLGAREYDPGLGKFVSVDPVQDLADPQQWNAYSYSENEPVGNSDPTGLRSDPNVSGCAKGGGGACGQPRGAYCEGKKNCDPTNGPKAKAKPRYFHHPEYKYKGSTTRKTRTGNTVWYEDRPGKPFKQPKPKPKPQVKKQYTPQKGGWSAQLCVAGIFGFGASGVGSLCFAADRKGIGYSRTAGAGFWFGGGAGGSAGISISNGSLDDQGGDSIGGEAQGFFGGKAAVGVSKSRTANVWTVTPNVGIGPGAGVGWFGGTHTWTERVWVYPWADD